MSADEHLARAEQLLGQADDLWRTYVATPSWPDQISALEGARTAASIAHARIAMAREVRIRDELPTLLAPPASESPGMPAKPAGATHEALSPPKEPT